MGLSELAGSRVCDAEIKGMWHKISLLIGTSTVLGGIIQNTGSQDGIRGKGRLVTS